MNTFQYTRLFDLEVLHDYYLFDGEFLEGYNILNDLDFLPTHECARLLKRYRCLYKKHTRGFSVLAESDGSNTIIPIDEDVKFQFIMVLKNPYFVNFSNLRLTGGNNFIYRFSNSSEEEELTFPFLHRDLPEFDAPGITISFSDLLINEGELIESIVNEPDAVNEANFLVHGAATSYVSALDRVLLQYPTFRFERSELNPGELITFQLIDENGEEVELGNIPNTEQPQNLLTVPDDGAVNHTINLSGLSFGRYEMAIDSVSISETASFYLFDPLKHPKAFGIIELYASTTDEAYQFLEFEEEPRATPIDTKFYQIKFKNRTTEWQFYNSAGEELVINTPSGEEDPLLVPLNTRFGLTKQFQNINAAQLNEAEDGTIDLALPNPSVAFLYPVPSPEDAGLILNINSKIYLNQ